MNTLGKVILLSALSIGALLYAPVLMAQQNTTTDQKVIAKQQFSVDALLKQVEQGHRQDIQDNIQRFNAYKDNLAEQQNMLKKIISDRKQAEALSLQREQLFEKNEQQISLLQARLSERLGSLNELFGVLQLVASDAQGQFENSLIQIHYPDRSVRLNEFAEKMGQTSQLPTIEEIEGLWFELQREMTESGKVTQSQHKVLAKDGTAQLTQVTRIGTFNLLANEKYIQRFPETGQLAEYPKQPSRRYMTGVEELIKGESAFVAFTIDPIRGQLISLLGNSPNLSERIQQGGVIGYIILSLGVVVVLLALYRYIVLTLESRQIQQQLLSLDTPNNSSLGSIVKVYHQSKHEPLDSLELKLGEAVLKAVPSINKGLSFIKISAAIAPLLGLLGTVTGMIITFQAITLFGAGDPKLMAGGISQALITTVLGLTVAIPSLLLHNLVQSKATAITQILEQESVALVALHSEANVNQNKKEAA